MERLKISVVSPDDMRNRALALEKRQQFQAYASQRAALMFGCYRKAEASDPEIYAAATASVLSEYPQEVIDYITDPRTGLPSQSKWLPSVFEVREACDMRVAIMESAAKLRAMAQMKRNVVANPNATLAQKAQAQEWLSMMEGNKYLEE